MCTAGDSSKWSLLRCWIHLFRRREASSIPKRDCVSYRYSCHHSFGSLCSYKKMLEYYLRRENYIQCIFVFSVPRHMVQRAPSSEGWRESRKDIEGADDVVSICEIWSCPSEATCLYWLLFFIIIICLLHRRWSTHPSQPFRNRGCQPILERVRSYSVNGKRYVAAPCAP